MHHCQISCSEVEVSGVGEKEAWDLLKSPLDCFLRGRAAFL